MTIWEKISILTSFIGGLTALIVAIAGVVTVQVQSSRPDAVAESSVAATKSTKAETKTPERGKMVTATGWAYLGQTKFNPVSIGQTYTFKKDTNIRSDYPRFPFYQFAPIQKVVPKGAKAKVLDVRNNVGIRNFTWIYVTANWEEGGT